MLKTADEVFHLPRPDLGGGELQGRFSSQRPGRPSQPACGCLLIPLEEANGLVEHARNPHKAFRTPRA